MKEDNEMEINTLMQEYALSTTAIANAKQHMANMMEVIKASPTFKQFQSFVEVEQPKLNEIQEQIKSAALDIFTTTQSKKPIECIGIREMTSITFDEKQAVTWAKERMPELLTIDKGKFEKIMQAIDESDRPEWVKVEKNAQVTFAKDFSAWLPKMDGE